MTEPAHRQLAMPMLLVGMMLLLHGTVKRLESTVDFTYEWHTFLLLGIHLLSLTGGVSFFLYRMRGAKAPVPVVVYGVLCAISALCVVLLSVYSPGVHDCVCGEGQWGPPDCVECSCEYGVCHPETGECACEAVGADINQQCGACLPNWLGPDCVECKDGFKEGCQECEVGRDPAGGCANCSVGWAGDHCEKCADGWWGNPRVQCEECSCALGTCLANNHVSFDDNVCTPDGVACGDDVDCASGSCGGRCIPTSREPAEDLMAYYANVVCRSDADCGKDEPMYYGQCTNKMCCQEARFGDGSCIDCPVGHRSPRCDVCPGYVSGLDVVCNGHGTCEEGAVCGCQEGYSGHACQKVNDTCVEGFYCDHSGGSCQCKPYPGVQNWNGLTACSGNADSMVGGVCTCHPHFVGDDCSECANGRFGRFCDRECPGLEVVNADVVKVCGVLWPSEATCHNGTLGNGTCICANENDNEYTCII